MKFHILILPICFILSANAQMNGGMQVSANNPNYSSNALFQWTNFPGSASAISVGASGSLWCLGTNRIPGGFSIYYWDGANWVNVDGAAEKIAVGSNGQAWAINSNGELYRRDGNFWTFIPGSAGEIAVGANGTVWALGSNQVDGGLAIYKYVNDNWMPIDGGAMKIAVTPTGQLWAVNNMGNIFRRDGFGWTPMPGSAHSISIGSDGTVWVLGTNQMQGGYTIWYWTGTGWTQVPGGAMNISGGARGQAFIIDNQNAIYQITANSMNQSTQNNSYQNTNVNTNQQNNIVVNQQAPAVVGCNGAAPMGQDDFNQAVETIRNTSFDETKLTSAKQVAQSNCLNVDQIIAVCKTFGFEQTMLDFSKYAYDHCTNPRNYYRINTVFSFSSSADELNSYVQSKQ